MNPYDTSDDNTTWINSNTANTETLNFTFTTTGVFLPNYVKRQIIPDRNWMPYHHFEYIPKWHQKFARIKLQMQSMWD